MMKLPDKYRIVTATQLPDYGSYRIPDGKKYTLQVIASLDDENTGWEHVSCLAVVNVGLKTQIPSWRQMCIVKEYFWPPEDTVVQFHPPKSDHVNCHPHVLHLWRHKVIIHQLPPKFLVL